ncbi:hypothetical protein MIND_01172200 [Mycena indigotica]|uniref:Protein kinase domain-containing protein n=1 Tax=Mycena indigotica TaxID=2126181 RepID=A0A8H6VSY1_9AGAR|nr:uncharacterized protein MIND_01172200 [Mycena indigotica]KAF7292739.1 hypothetical protein MIND_01172200 [Mycena indigotica]
MSHTPIEVQFESPPSGSVHSSDPPFRVFSARMWRIPGVRGPFSPLPPAAHTLSIASDSIFINSYSGNNRISIPLADARRWGLREDKRVQFARATAPNGQRFCLRFIFHADTVMQEGDPTWNQRFIQALVDDAKFHIKHLQTVAGLLVPQNYGMWVMETGDWAGTVLFSLTQWCGTPWKSLLRTELNTKANNLLIGRVCEMLHDLGVKITGRMGSSEDLCHIILDVEDPAVTKEMAKNGEARCYIVDFSHARRHNCKRRLPLVPLGRDAFRLLMQTPTFSFGCPELENIAHLLDFTPRGLQYPSEPPETPIGEAMKWRDDYLAAHPSYSNAAVLVAQRVALFPNALPVYPGLKVSGVSKEDMSAELTLYDCGRGYIDPASLIKGCSRDEYEYLLWGNKMEAKAIAMDAQPLPKWPESAPSGHDSADTS